MEYQIKLAQNQDWQKYKKIRLETLQEEPYAFSSSYDEVLKYPDQKWQEILSDEHSTYLYICYGDEVIGVGRITFNDPEEPLGTAYIGGVYINKLHRGKSLGRKLLLELLNKASLNSDVKVVKLEVTENQLPAINLYKSLGFEIVGKKDDELVMLKTLSL
jgi:ribosomal protein S18 acetylase RimI-like enzyme